jgi:hypothetical protein
MSKKASDKPPVLPWFRLWHEVLRDMKVQKLTPYDFKAWVNLLCVAARNDPRGVLPDIDTVSYELDIRNKPRVQKLLDRLEEAGLLDQLEPGVYSPHNWDKRQIESDNVTARTRAYRERQKSTKNHSVVTALSQHDHSNVTATSQDTPTAVNEESGNQATLPAFGNVSGNAPRIQSTDTDTEGSNRASIITNNQQPASSKRPLTATPRASLRPTALLWPKGLDASFVSLWIEQSGLPESPNPTGLAVILEEFKGHGINIYAEGVIMGDWLRDPKHANKRFNNAFVRNWLKKAADDAHDQRKRGKGNERDSHSDHSGFTHEHRVKPSRTADIEAAAASTTGDYTDAQWFDDNSIRNQLVRKAASTAD